MLTASEAKEEVLAHVSHFHGIDQLNLYLPEVDLQRIQDQFMSEDDKFSQTWDKWREEYENHASKLWIEFYSSDDEDREFPHEAMVVLGLLTLPRDLLRGAHKLVFGVVTEQPTWFAIRVLIGALFNSELVSYGQGPWLRRLYDSAKAEQTRRLKLQADVDHLLAALEV